MNSWALVQLLLIQCCQLAVLVLIVAVLARVFRGRPQLTHALCALVLLKAITPPIYSLAWSPFSWLMNLAAMLPTLTQRMAILPVDQAGLVEPALATSAIGASDSVNMAEEITRVSYSWGVDAAGSEFWLAMCLVWLVSAGATVTLTVVRYWQVVRQLKRFAAVTVPEIESSFEQLRHKLGLHRQVGLHVHEANLGPFVIGFWRPTIVLPAMLVRGKSLAEIEPLLTHELIHIRRGDLWWALLQVIARSLFWFHPAVRWAESQLTQAAELCCDEETIRFLGCAPATYARCLLNVLEQKHRLQVASALPGVRPLEITKDRLERVMKTGKTSSRRSPMGGWLVLLVGCVLTLPGAASVGVSQDEPTEDHKPMFVVSYHLIETTRQAMATDGLWKNFEWEDTGVQAERFQESLMESNGGKDDTHPESFPVPMARLDKLESELLRESLQKRGESDLSPTTVVKLRPTVVTFLQQTATVQMGGEIPFLKANRDVGGLNFGTQLKATPDKFEDQVVTLELEFEVSEPTTPKPGQGSVATGVEGIRLTTLQELPLDSFIAFEVPQPERNNEPMVVLVQCWKVVDAPTGAKPLASRSGSPPLPPTPVVPPTTIPKFN
ncbi:MAG: hypothetical protein JNL67_17370 [Planctomycetaceae bacterium]|nr:hypothetical protein [Planctomycetaceae bacterium]